jgi:hypothetical protein
MGKAGGNRFMNIFQMSVLEVAEHGASTGVRGGNNNVPDFDGDFTQVKEFTNRVQTVMVTLQSRK